ncbi:MULTISPECIES: TetR/AcrR family transcriptional regulator [Mycobacteriaceae]|jgi:AcrR family transcriptional regulator|uniref:Transcriptional regulator, TetR family n=1 Tax=Mycolicibacterium fluoranthenivorans TaxID=258505 RepID=A0A1G4WWU4_9MYCO|nr:MULTISPECIES: TetR/AcrR family transcriptional regulator [Mycobacteriaceae]MCV7252270.1 TetR/AcrR family transcriptional regulator [Mycobacterium hackensackense]SCX31252.1 transcriptional regulator, TetR family [Mycolicibacterium fluoranthenivorans]
MLSSMASVKPARTRPTRDEVRDRILDAALEVFAAEGFAGTTIDAIGQAAGFTKGAVYSNFESKDELFLALLDRQFETRSALIATAFGAGRGDIKATAEALSRSMLGSIHDESQYQLVLFEYWLRAVRDPALRDRLIARRRAAVEQAMQVVEGAQTGLPSQRLADLAQLVVTVTAGVALEEMLQPGVIRADMIERLITRLLESVPGEPVSPQS